MSREEFIKQRKYLFWYVLHPEKVSDESLVEAVLNFGDWEDVQGLIQLLGIEKVADIFERATHRDRINYAPITINFFNLYFAKHASRNFKQGSKRVAAISK